VSRAGPSWSSSRRWASSLGQRPQRSRRRWSGGSRRRSPPMQRSNRLKGPGPGRRRRPGRATARPQPPPARRVLRLLGFLGVLGSVSGRSLTLARGRRPAMTRRPQRPPVRLRVFRPCPGPPLTGRPTAPRNARPRPMAPSRTGPPRFPRPPMRRPGRCRRSLRRLRPGPGLNPVPLAPTQGPRGLRARSALRGRRGPRSPRPTSAARGRAKAARPAPPLRVPAHRVARGDSAQAPPRAVPTRVVRVPGRPRRGPRDLVRPGRVRPGQADPVRARALRAPARGRAITHSVRLRPAWGRRLPLGPRAQARLVSPAVPVLRPAARAAPEVQGGQGVRVRLGAVRVGRACPMAAQGVRVPAAPGLAR